jgi:hypothetical protein
LGEPLFIKNYVGPDKVMSINSFKDALEMRVKKMMMEIIRAR